MKKTLIFIIVPMLFLMTGCMPESTQNTSAVKAVAFDAAEGGIKLTALMLNPGGEKPYITVSTEGRNMRELVSGLNDVTEKKPFFTQCEVMVFSRELAKKGVGGILEWFTSSEGRKEALCIVSEGTAEDVFSYTEGLFKVPSSDISRMIKNSHKNGSGICITAQEANAAKNSFSKTSLVPICTLGGEDGEKSLQITGAGILKDGAFTGSLSKNELMGVKIILSSEAGYTSDSLPVKLTYCRTQKRAFNNELQYSVTAAYMPETGSTVFDDTEKELALHIKKCVLLAADRAKKDGDFLGILANVPSFSKKYSDADRALEEINITADVTVKMSEGLLSLRGNEKNE